jgi:hypothetical protein
MSFGNTFCSTLFLGFFLKEKKIERNIPAFAQIIKIVTHGCVEKEGAGSRHPYEWLRSWR